MENLKKTSKPPSSLNLSRRADDGSGSSGSTPSEDYKTPSLENASLPGFDFTSRRKDLMPREGEPESPTKLQQLLQNAGLRNQSGGVHGWLNFDGDPANPEAREGVARSVYGSGLVGSSVKSNSRMGRMAFSAEEKASQLPAGYGSLVNGSATRAQHMTSAKVSSMPTSRYAGNDARESPFATQALVSRQAKRTTFAPPPNQTTWLGEMTHKSPSEGDPGRLTDEGAVSPSTELTGIRLKLEERRRQIESEKKRMEQQWTKQRQQIGKEAFIQVVTKNKLGSTSQTDIRNAESDKPVYHRESSDVNLMPQKQSVRTVIDGQSFQSQRFSSSPQRVVDSDEGNASFRRVIDEHNSFVYDKNLNRNSHSMRLESPTLSTKSSPKPNQVKDGAGSSFQKTKTVEKQGQDSRVIQESVGRAPVSVSQRQADVGEYSTSLDRLNSSLTELQGEIMRLSLQQDQIKSLVGSDLDQPSKPSYPAAAPAAQSNSKEQFYLFPRNAVGIQESGILSSKRPNISNMSSTPTAVTSIYKTQQPGIMTSAVDGAAQPAHMGSYPFPQHYANPPGHFPQYFHAPPPPPPSNFVSGPYALPLAQTASPSVPAYLPPFSNFQQPLSHNPGMYSGGGWGEAGFNYQEALHKHGDPSRETAAIAAPMSSGTPLMIKNVYLPPAFVSSSEVPGFCTSMPSTIPPSSGPSHTAPLHDLNLSDPVDGDIPSPGSAGTGGANSSSDTPSTQETSASSTPAPAPSQAFYMILDSDLPRRPKPVLGINSRLRKESDIGRQNSLSSLVVNRSSSEVESGRGEAQAPPPPLQSGSDSAFNSAPSLGFVIGDDGNIDETLQQEVEKKRQRMSELHQKRREELEMAKQKIEVVQQTKREAQRLKQEEIDQKKAEKRSRRDAIFQNYLQKKADEDGSEEDQKAAVAKRLVITKNKTPRPKSQPPSAAINNINEERRLYNAQFSQDRFGDRRGASPGSENLSKSSERINLLSTNFEQLEARLAFGGLTQCRPPTPDRVPRFVSSGSDGGSDGGGNGCQLPDNYAGPKLFVKPSQKSNRHIIINAIKDCCLAGLVNQDTKNKVLEEISKSDSKHFVILFRDAGMQFRGLYTYNPDREDVFKIHGVGPNRLLDKMMEKFYKYNSGAKNFSEITSTKHLSATIDAVTIMSTLWQKKPTSSTPGKRLV